MRAQPRDNNTDLRGLKALVIILGVLILLGTALVIGVVIKRLYANPAAPSISAMVPGGSLAVGSLPAASLAVGEHIAGIAGAGGAFAVWVTGPGGDRVLLLNPQTGAVSTALAPAK